MKIKSINGKLNIIGNNLRKLYGLRIYYSDIHKIEHYTKTVRDYEVKGFCKALNISLEELYENTDSEFE